MWALRKYLLTFIDSNIQRLHQVLIKSMCMNVNGPDQRMIFFHGFLHRPSQYNPSQIVKSQALVEELPARKLKLCALYLRKVQGYITIIL